MTQVHGFAYRWRDPVAAPQAKGMGIGGAPSVSDAGAPAPIYRRGVESGMIIERNVAIAMRDGIEIFADVFRPVDESPAPPIIAWSPYGKHQNGSLEGNPKTNVQPGMVSKYATFEGPDPVYWVPQGYAVVNVDIRGMWYSKGDATFLSPEEAQDFYDLIEWAGVQPWSNGRVGLSGVSYLSVTQWRVAALQPPHLAAMNIWEGWSDTYREVAYHGGIPDTWFWSQRLVPLWGTSTTRIEDLTAEMKEHPLFDAFWASKAADFSTINVAAFIVASWADQGMHLRGTLEGFKKIASQQKWLEIHGRKKWAHYYSPDSLERLREFFDHFLKGRESSLTQWPPVRMEIREKYYAGEIRGENEWPPARTHYTKLYLDANNGALRETPAPQGADYAYSSLGSGPGVHRAEFEFVFDRETELVGHSKLKIFMSTDDSDDMDIFVGLYKFDSSGQFVPLAYYTMLSDGPVALGWLRASHRELDQVRSTEFQPVHAHERELKLEKGEVVPLEIEIWPSGTSFQAGERLRLIVQGTDLQKYSKISDPVYARHEDSVNSGNHIIHTGGHYESYLLVPVIPSE